MSNNSDGYKEIQLFYSETSGIISSHTIFKIVTKLKKLSKTSLNRRALVFERWNRGFHVKIFSADVLKSPKPTYEGLRYLPNNIAR